MSYGYQTADPVVYRLLKEYARHNRNNPTDAEELLWQYLKSEGLGVTFKRQHIIGDYIADFVCLTERLIIELDGGYHQTSQQMASDAQRTQWLENRGFRVLRFTNEELFNDVNKVLYTIENIINGNE